MIVILSGIHGDEPAGNIAANYYSSVQGITVIADINTTGKRRLNNKDLNRHFHKREGLQKEILDKIISINPRLVISLHEDDSVDGAYAYCSQEMITSVQDILGRNNIPTALQVHIQATRRGVIGERPPWRGTLEAELRKLNIPYVTFETPSQLSLARRIAMHKMVVDDLITFVKNDQHHYQI